MESLLSIAGLDPSGGAGLTQDLEVFAALGFHGLSALTALVIQGPYGVHKVVPTCDEDFSHTLAVLEEEIGVPAGVKLGVIASEEQVVRVARYLRACVGLPIVLDPVLRAKNGTVLTSEGAVRRLVEEILPLGPVITPNLAEAEALTGLKVSEVAGMRESARVLCGLGAAAVVVKGGHLSGPPVDVLFDRYDFTEYEGERVPGEVHGTGCLFSALLLAYLARGYELAEAFLATEERMQELLATRYQLSDRAGAAEPAKGVGGALVAYSYTSPGLVSAQESERFRVLEALRQAGQELARLAPVELMPAVQMNLGFALPGAQSVLEVAGFPGRIGSHAGRLVFKGEPLFGASSHVARLILTTMQRFPQVRACINLKLSEECISKARRNGLMVLEADRSSEPYEVKKTEGLSLDFLMEQVLAGVAKAPDIVYDRGEVGKEPLIRLFGRTPADVIQKLTVVRP